MIIATGDVRRGRDTSLLWRGTDGSNPSPSSAESGTNRRRRVRGRRTQNGSAARSFAQAVVRHPQGEGRAAASIWRTAASLMVMPRPQVARGLLAVHFGSPAARRGPDRYSSRCSGLRRRVTFGSSSRPSSWWQAATPCPVPSWSCAAAGSPISCGRAVSAGSTLRDLYREQRPLCRMLQRRRVRGPLLHLHQLVSDACGRILACAPGYIAPPPHSSRQRCPAR